MRLVTAVRIAEILSGVVLLLFALTIPMARWVLMAGYIVAASTAFYASSRLLTTRSARVIGIALALFILVPSVPRVVSNGIPVLPSSAAAVSYSLGLLLLVCQLFVLVVALRAFRARASA